MSKEYIIWLCLKIKLSKKIYSTFDDSWNDFLKYKKEKSKNIKKETRSKICGMKADLIIIDDIIIRDNNEY